MRDKKLNGEDLVLLYPSKKHKWKLKLTKNGPYQWSSLKCIIIVLIPRQCNYLVLRIVGDNPI